MGPFGTYFHDDLEDTALGAPPCRWSAPGPLTLCIAHRGSHWAELSAGAYPLIHGGTQLPARVEIDLEIPVLGPPPSGAVGFRLEPRLAMNVIATADPPGYAVSLGGTAATLSGLLGAPHHLDIALEGGEWLYRWDGDLVARIPALPRLEVNDVRAWASGVGTRLLLDHLRFSREEVGGVALATDGTAVARAAGLPSAAGQPGPRLVTSYGPPGFGPDDPLLGRRAPALALLADGGRVLAVEDDLGVLLWRTDAVAGDPARGRGRITVLLDHSRPALCALPERGEVLLLTCHEGRLWLTRGRLAGDDVEWLIAARQPLAVDDAAEATPAICPLPDGRLLVCYQDERCAVHSLVSPDGGVTWL